MECPKCKGKSVLKENGEPYEEHISLNFKNCTVVGCYKDIKKGEVSFTISVPDHRKLWFTFTIPIEYWHMCTEEREWDHNINEHGERKK